MDRKRLLDLALIVPTLPIYAPLTGSLAALVWIVDGRPILFRQPRVGQDGGTFEVMKLRTMTTDDDPEQRRETRLGTWLRQRGLDELPQLLNVIRGDMSLVGPRPLTRADFERLCAQEPAFAARTRLRPGITGLAQARGARGLQETVAQEAEYAERTSARLDVEILVRTTWINLVGKRRGRWRTASSQGAT